MICQFQREVEEKRDGSWIRIKDSVQSELKPMCIRLIDAKERTGL